MHLLLIVTNAGKDHNRQLSVDLTDEGDQRNAVYFRHLKIDHGHVAVVLREPVRGLESIGERLTGMAFLTEVSDEESGDGGIVIDDEKLGKIAGGRSEERRVGKEC